MFAAFAIVAFWLIVAVAWALLCERVEWWWERRLEGQR